MWAWIKSFFVSTVVPELKKPEIQQQIIDAAKKAAEGLKK